MSRPIDIGDYVLASKFKDHSPNDPWFVGQVTAIIFDGNEHKRYYEVEWKHRWWGYVKRITKEQGEKILSEYPKLELTAKP